MPAAFSADLWDVSVEGMGGRVTDGLISMLFCRILHPHHHPRCGRTLAVPPLPPNSLQVLWGWLLLIFG